MPSPCSDRALGLLETHGLTPAMVALDVMTKTAQVRVVQVELNDLCGVCLQVTGTTAEVQTALAAGRETAAAMAGRPVTHCILRVATAAAPGIRSAPEYNPLIQQQVVFARDTDQSPTTESPPDSGQPPHTMRDQPPAALGFIETQGFTAVMEALDTACKAADVTVVGKEKLGGGYVTVVIQGELSAVAAAIQAGQAKVDGLGKLIAAHVIARPSDAVRSLVPQL
jgi:carbon dioxide concentrating mechanism protein CcmO